MHRMQRKDQRDEGSWSVARKYFLQQERRWVIFLQMEGSGGEPLSELRVGGMFILVLGDLTGHFQANIVRGVS